MPLLPYNRFIALSAANTKVGIELIALNAQAAIADLNKYTQSLSSLDQAGSQASSSLGGSMSNIESSSSTAMKSAGASSLNLGNEMNTLGSTSSSAGQQVTGTFQSIEQAGSGVEGTSIGVTYLGDAMIETSDSSGQLSSELTAGISPLNNMDRITQQLTGDEQALAETTEGTAGSMGTLRGSAMAQVGSLATLGGSVTSLWQTYDGFASAGDYLEFRMLRLNVRAEYLEKAQRKLATIVAEGKEGTQEHADAVRDVDQAQQALQVTTNKYNNALGDYNVKMASFYQQIGPQVMTFMGSLATTYTAFSGPGGLLDNFKKGLSSISIESLRSGKTFLTMGEGLGVFKKGTLDATTGLSGMDKVMKMISLTNPFFIALTVGVGIMALFVTNTFGIRDAINGIGQAIGDAVPFLRPFLAMIGQLGEAVAGLFGGGAQEAQAFEGAVTGSVANVTTETQDMATQWHNALADMQRSDNEFVAAYANSIVNITDANEQMKTNFQNQMQATGQTWDEFIGKLTSGDLEGAVDLMIASFGAIPGIVMQIANDSIHYFGTIGTSILDLTTKGLEQFVSWGTDVVTAIGEAIDTVVEFFTILGDRIIEAVMPILDPLIDALGLRPFVDFMTELVTEAAEVINGILDFVTVTVTEIWDSIVGDWVGIEEWVMEFISDPINSFIDLIENGGKLIYDKLIEDWIEITDWVDTNIIQPINDFDTYLKEGGSWIRAQILAGWEDLTDWVDVNIITPINDFDKHLKEGGAWIRGQIVAGWEDLTGWVDENIITPINDFDTQIKEGGAWIRAQIVAGWIELTDWVDKNIIQPINDFDTFLEEGGAHIRAQILAGWIELTDWVTENIVTPINDFDQDLKEGGAWIRAQVVAGWEDLVDWVDVNIVTPINDFAGSIEAGGIFIHDKIIEGYENLEGWVTSDIVTPINNFIGEVEEGGKSIHDKIIQGYEDLKDWVSLNIVLPINNFILSVTAAGKPIYDKIIEGWLDLTAWVDENIVTPLKGWIDKIEAVADVIWEKWGLKELVNNVTEIVTEIGGFIMSIPDHIYSIWQAIWDKLGLGWLVTSAENLGGDIASGIMSLIDHITGIGETIWEKLFGDYDLVHAADVFGENIAKAVAPHVNTIINMFTNAANTVSEFFASLSPQEAEGEELSTTDINNNKYNNQRTLDNMNRLRSPEEQLTELPQEMKLPESEEERQRMLEKSAPKPQQQAPSMEVDSGPMSDLAADVEKVETAMTKLTDAIGATKKELTELSEVLTTHEGQAKLVEQGTLNRAKAFGDLQVALLQSIGYNQQYMKDITEGHALNIAHAAGVEEQKKAIMDQAVALATAIGKHEELSRQMDEGIPQALAFMEATYKQRDALNQMEIATAANNGTLTELKQQLADGTIQQQEYNAAVVETALQFAKQEAQIAASKGVIDGYNTAISEGTAQLLAYAEGQIKTMRSAQDAEIALSASAGSLDAQNKLLQIGIPQYAAYNQALIDVKQANADLVTEFASLYGEAEGLFAALGDVTTVSNMNSVAFMKAKVSVAAWGEELLTADSANAGMMKGLEELANSMNVTVPEGVKHTEESLKAYIAVTAEIPSHIREVASEMYDAGLGMAQELASGLEKGGEESDKAIEKLEEKIGMEMPEKMREAVISSGIGANMLEDLDTQLKLGMTAFHNMDLKDITESTQRMAETFGEGLDKMDEVTRSKVEATMNQITELLKKGPDENTPEGIQKFMAQVNALMLQAKAEADPTVQALEKIGEVQPDTTQWISLKDALADGKITADELASGITGISDSANPVVAAIAELNTAVADGTLTQAEYNTAIAELQGAVDPASESLTEAKSPTDQLGEAFKLTGEKLSTLHSILVLLPQAVAESVGIANEEWGKMDPIPAEGLFTTNMAIFHEKLLLMPTDVETAVTGSNENFALLNPTSEMFSNNMMILHEVLLQLPIEVETAVTGSNEQFNLLNPTGEMFVNNMGILSEILIQLPAEVTTSVTESNVQFNLLNPTGETFVNNMGILSEILLQLPIDIQTSVTLSNEQFMLLGLPLTEHFPVVIANTHLLLDNFVIKVTESFETSRLNATTSIDTLEAHIATFLFQMFESLANVPIWFNDNFEAARTNADNSLSTLTSRLAVFYGYVEKETPKIAEWFTSSFNTAVDNAAGSMNSLRDHMVKWYEFVNGSTAQIPIWFNAAFKRASEDTNGHLITVQHTIKGVFDYLVRVVNEVPGQFNAAFQRATRDAWGHVNVLQRDTVGAMNAIIQAAADAAREILSIGESAKTVQREVEALKNTLESLPNIEREITYRVRQVGTVPAGAVEHGLVNAVGVPRFEQGFRSQAIVGENGKEIVSMADLGITGRTNNPTTFVTSGVEKVDYTGKVLTVIPLQGRNAEIFGRNNPMFRPLQDAVNDGILRLERGTTATISRRQSTVQTSSGGNNIQIQVQFNGNEMDIGELKGGIQDWVQGLLAKFGITWPIPNIPPIGDGGGINPPLPTIPPALHPSLLHRMTIPEDWGLDIPEGMAVREFAFNTNPYGTTTPYDLDKGIGQDYNDDGDGDGDNDTPTRRRRRRIGWDNNNNNVNVDLDKLLRTMDRIFTTLLSKNINGNALWQDQSRISFRNIGNYL